MYPVSAAYKTAIAQNVRDVKVTGIITLKDETAINIVDADIVLGSLYFSEQCVAGEDIEIGNVYASELGLSLVSPPEDPYSLDGARIIINFGLNVEPDPKEDPIWEYVPLGYFYVTEIERKHAAVSIKALDGMILFDVDLSSVLTSGTPFQIISSCCSKVAVVLANSSGEFNAFANGATSFTLPADNKVETCRDLVMWVCQVTGTFARMNRAGQLEIVPIAAGSSIKTISKAERFTSDVSDLVVKVTKVAMKVGEAEYTQGTDGMTMALEENPLLADKGEAAINVVLANILAQVTEAEYTPCAVDFVGDPALQAGDVVVIDDAGILNTETETFFLAPIMPFEFHKNTATIIITHTSWRYRGPHNIRATGKSGLLRGVQQQQQKTVSSIQARVQAAQDIAQAANQSTQLINDAIGGHVLIRREPGGTNEILIMDNSDPELATKIWRWNMGGLGYSDNVTGADNPARDYVIAMTIDGAINANFLTIGGIDAGIIQTGVLKANIVIGSTNNVDYYVDGATGNDNNDGLSPGNPFATIEKAINMIPWMVQHTITIYVADGTYQEDVSINNKLGSGKISLIGNDANPVNCKVKTIFVDSCLCGIYVRGFDTTNIRMVETVVDVPGFDPIYSYRPVCFFARFCTYIMFRSCYATAISPAPDQQKDAFRLTSVNFADVHYCLASNCYYGTALTADGGSKVFSFIWAAAGSNNNTGLRANAASEIVKSGQQPAGTTAQSIGAGGLIRT